MDVKAHSPKWDSWSVAESTWNRIAEDERARLLLMTADERGAWVTHPRLVPSNGRFHHVLDGPYWVLRAPIIDLFATPLCAAAFLDPGW